MLIKGSHDLGRQHMMPLPCCSNGVFYLEHPAKRIPRFISVSEMPNLGKPHKPKEPCPTPSIKLFSSNQILASSNLNEPLCIPNDGYEINCQACCLVKVF